MARCWVSGVEIAVEAAWVLHLYEARRYRRQLLDTLETLERQTKELGEDTPVRPSEPQKDGVKLRRQRKLVSDAVAESIGAGLGNDRLFQPFPEFRGRRHVEIAERLRRNAVYGAAFSALELGEQINVVKLGGAVIRRLFPPGATLDPKVRSAITGGVCLTLRGQSSHAIVHAIRSRLAAGAAFRELGVAEDDEPALLAALGRLGGQK